MTAHTPRPCYLVPALDDPRLAVKVGDRVRSYDFPCAWDFRPAAWADVPALRRFAQHATGLCDEGPHACYRDGLLVAITDEGQYEIEVYARVWQGVREDIDTKVFPPVNGRETLDSHTFGVHVIA
ncbi:hypothetical protein K0U83_05595 [bacterium]|nr:hypothetical protein [bacterium]